jgi:RimJ/RimL family protein N-acetyltransferase
MRDAVLAALTWVIQERGVRVVVVGAMADNPSSWKLIDSLDGFVRDNVELEINWLECKGGGKRKALT